MTKKEVINMLADMVVKQFGVLKVVPEKYRKEVFDLAMEKVRVSKHIS